MKYNKKWERSSVPIKHHRLPKVIYPLILSFCDIKTLTIFGQCSKTSKDQFHNELKKRHKDHFGECQENLDPPDYIVNLKLLDYYNNWIEGMEYNRILITRGPLTEQQAINYKKCKYALLSALFEAPLEMKKKWILEIIMDAIKPNHIDFITSDTKTLYHSGEDRPLFIIPCEESSGKFQKLIKIFFESQVPPQNAIIKVRQQSLYETRTDMLIDINKVIWHGFSQISQFHKNKASIREHCIRFSEQKDKVLVGEQSRCCLIF